MWAFLVVVSGFLLLECKLHAPYIFESELEVSGSMARLFIFRSVHTNEKVIYKEFHNTNASIVAGEREIRAFLDIRQIKAYAEHFVQIHGVELFSGEYLTFSDKNEQTIRNLLKEYNRFAGYYMEYCTLGDLYGVEEPSEMATPGAYMASFLERLHHLRHIAEGLARLHEAGLEHFDLKPENIFLCNVQGSPMPKIADFGFTSRQSFVYSEKMAPQEWMNANADNYFRPPEMEPFRFQTHRQTGEYDMWAFGVLATDYLIPTYYVAERSEHLDDVWWKAPNFKFTFADTDITEALMEYTNIAGCSVSVNRRCIEARISKCENTIQGWKHIEHVLFLSRNNAEVPADVFNGREHPILMPIARVIGSWVKSLLVCDVRSRSRPLAAHNVKKLTELLGILKEEHKERERKVLSSEVSATVFKSGRLTSFFRSMNFMTVGSYAVKTLGRYHCALRREGIVCRIVEEKLLQSNVPRKTGQSAEVLRIPLSRVPCIDLGECLHRESAKVSVVFTSMYRVELEFDAQEIAEMWERELLRWNEDQFEFIY